MIVQVYHPALGMRMVEADSVPEGWYRNPMDAVRARAAAERRDDPVMPAMPTPPLAPPEDALHNLQEEARHMGIKVDLRWREDRLRREIERAS